MGQKKTTRRKASKGEVGITNAEGIIRLRWRYQGQRYSLNLSLNYMEHNLPKASITAAQIKLDMIQGNFDTTLAKYGKALPIEKIETTPAQIVKSEPRVYFSFVSDLVAPFDHWAANIRNVNIEQSAKYNDLRRILVQWGKHPLESLPALMASENWSASTYNGRLGYFRIFLDYLTRKKKITENPLDDVNRKKHGRKTNTKREPLTEDEIGKLLDAFITDKFTSKYSKHKHSHYYPFLYFMFATGVRNAEAIGLRVKNVDIPNRIVKISEVLARTSKDTNHAARVVKGTKTENVRILPLTENFCQLLQVHIEGKDTNDLVFPSPRGKSIDDHMFERRILKPVLQKLGLGNKDLYVARHSFGTRAIQQGMVITDVAYLMGHSTIETAMRNYVSVSRLSSKLPKLDNG
jgi:integrase